VYASATGRFLRWFTPTAIDLGLPQVSPNRQWVYFIEVRPDHCAEIVRRPYAGGAEQVVRDAQHGGAQPFAVGPGQALAGTDGCMATAGFDVRTVDGTELFIYGERNVPANGMAWSPSGRTLAISGIDGHIYLLPVGHQDTYFVSPTVPCPADMSGCVTQAPAYSATGTLYYVAKSADHRHAEVVRLSGSAARPVFTLPSAPPVVHLSVAPSGAMLVAGDSDTNQLSSAFAGRWDGRVFTRISAGFIQPAW